MKLRHLQTLMPPADGLCRVTSLCFSPNNLRLAVVTVERVIHLFDEDGKRRDKFSTKPAEKTGPKTYMVTAMAFSPDSTMLAVAQSDNMVFVYKLGLDWGDRKSICNRFRQASSVTALAWPSSRFGDLICGTVDGGVHLCQLKSNRSTTLYTANYMTVSACASPDGTAFITGHADKSVHRYHYGDDAMGPSHSVFCLHSCIPTCVAWAEGIMAAGADNRVTFYDDSGAPARTFDYSDDEDARGFTSCAVNPGGDSIVVGGFDEYRIFSHASKARTWEATTHQRVPHLYTVTALAWKPDGSRVALGTLCGLTDVYDACLKRVLYKGRFEFTYVSPSQVIVKRLSSGARIVLRSTFRCEIGKVAVYRDRFIVAHTPETLMVGDLESCKLSEVAWRGGAEGSGERFLLEHPTVCAVYRAGELTLIEYGKNELLGSCLTEHLSPHLLSIRINERPPAAEDEAALALAAPPLDGEDDVPPENKKIAFLLDEQTVRVLDLTSNTILATVSHDCRIDWLELNGRGNLLLFRDRRHKLVLHDIFAGKSSTLLSHCSYVQWVPESDVVVAQSRSSLCVWYNIAAPDKVTSYDIKGDVEDIERADGRTEVVVDEGLNTASYLLDEGLIAFGTAIDDRDHDGAMDILEGLELSSETEAMWRRLGDATLEAGHLLIAQRCAAAVGDIARARFLHKTAKIARLAEQKLGTDGRDFWMVRARLAQLRGDFDEAEGVFLDAGKTDEAVMMYQTMHRFDEAIAVAESRGHGDTERMKREYLDFLLRSGQEDKAAEIKEAEGSAEEAVELYLGGGYPARAMAVVSSRPSSFAPELIERVAAALQTAGLSGRAGALFEKINDDRRALECYVRGNAFREAVELARRAFPAQVTKLEFAWGSHLASSKQLEQAINHFIEAGAHKEAIDAALRARQFSKAAQLISDMQLEVSESAPLYLELARQYRAAGRLREAEKAFVQAGQPLRAVQMYVEAGRWEPALSIANSSMGEDDVQALFTREGKRLAGEGKLRQAERVLLMVGQHSLAITMYKRAKQYDAMIRLVAKFHRDLLAQTHSHIAKALVKEGDHARAERHFVEAGAWKEAVAMHREAGRLTDARRVAKAQGGRDAWQREAYSQALEAGGEKGKELLRELGLVLRAIDYCCDTRDWDGARELARRHAPDKLKTITFKRALQLEDDGQFEEAEAEFISAQRPREAVEMHLHQKAWDSAMRVAEANDQSSVPRVLIAHANSEVASGNLDAALRLFLDAKQPELAVEAFIATKRYPEAMRTAKQHLPRDRAAAFQRQIKRLISGSEAGDGGDFHDVDGGAGGAAASGPSAHGRKPAAAPSDSAAGSLSMGAGGGTGAAAASAAAAAVSAAAIGSHGGVNHLENGRMYEASHEHALAIDEYLKVTEADASSQAARESAWMRATQLAASHDERRYEEVAVRAARLMGGAGSWEKAGDLFAGASKPEDAVGAYLRGKKFKKARQAAKEARSPALEKRVMDEEKAFNESSGDVAGLEQSGHVQSAVRVLVQQGRWESALEKIAKAKATELLEEVAPQRVNALLGERKAAEADVLYKVAAARRAGSAATAAAAAASGAAGAKADSSVIERALMACHYSAMASEAARLGLPALRADASLSLLRYCGVVPADRAFLEAGEACRDAGRLNVAYVMLNRFLDLFEAIEEGDANDIDNTDFEGTDIPSPLDFPLPAAHWLSEDETEEARKWVLSASVDKTVAQTLSHGDLPTAEQASQSRCAITGLPVSAADRVACTSCSSVAIRRAWNAIVAKTGACPWCSAHQAPFY
ncbi:hypothetical protein FNF31_03572 [Cafeteria roenbergensis]|uniref:Uncharacterized protein n=1 Tax=Cafeteria roenbergensis TaxID=33653 RepID=A0A5A8D8P8_CAFRO|nr:hypothetical protein FNF31_03572 [Cafeteria roenbergensis]